MLNQLKKNKKIKTFNLFLLLNSSNNMNSNKPSWVELLIQFYNIWPLTQWVSSLVTLILLYWLTGYYYNKWLSEKGGWLSWKTRSYMIVLDFITNLLLGFYYMGHRDTLMGHFMVTCPIAISPVIFLIELICVYVYHRWSYQGKK
jgi:hypothetical protein